MLIYVVLTNLGNSRISSGIIEVGLLRRNLVNSSLKLLQFQSSKSYRWPLKTKFYFRMKFNPITGNYSNFFQKSMIELRQAFFSSDQDHV